MWCLLVIFYQYLTQEIPFLVLHLIQTQLPDGAHWDDLPGRVYSVYGRCERVWVHMLLMWVCFLRGMHRLYIYHLYMIFIREIERERKKQKKTKREGEREIENKQQHVVSLFGVPPQVWNQQAVFSLQFETRVLSLMFIVIISVSSRLASKLTPVKIAFLLCKHDWTLWVPMFLRRESHIYCNIILLHHYIYNIL